MSLANYEPVVLKHGLNRVEFGGTEVEIPDDLPLYYMLPVGSVAQIKESSWNRQVRSGLNDTLLLGDVEDVQLYYDTRGRMTIPQKRMVVEVGRQKGVAPQVQRYITEFGGKRKTKSNRTKRRKTKRR
jgi:hypothetical protein